MKPALILAIAGLGIVSTTALADESATTQETTRFKPFQKLELKNSQNFNMSGEEVTEANKQVAESFQKQLEMSDPETKTAILNVQRDLQAKKAKEQNSDSN